MISFHPCFSKISAIATRKNKEELKTKLCHNCWHTSFSWIPPNVVDKRDLIGHNHIYGWLATTDCGWTSMRNVLHPHGCLQEYPYVIYKMCLMLSCCALWKSVLQLIWVNAHKATRWSLTRSACHHFNFNSVYDANSSWKDLCIST